VAYLSRVGNHLALELGTQGIWGRRVVRLNAVGSSVGVSEWSDDTLGI